MKSILQVDSSILGDHSVSRQLTAAIVRRLRTLEPSARVVYRDVVATPLPQITGAVAMGRTQPVAERDPAALGDIAALDAVLAEVLAADTIVIGAPMYNFGVASQLKAWLDSLAVAGVTYRYGASGPEGLLGGRRVVIASTRGGFYGIDSPQAPMDHQETHLRAFLEFLGITDFETIRAEGVKMGDETKTRAVAAALEQASALQAA